MKKLTQAQAVKRCRYWQEILGLAQWNCEVRVVRQREMTGDNQGELHVYDVHTRALIRLLDPLDWDGGTMKMVQDMETTLVHELVHLRLHALIPNDKNEHRDMLEEQAVDSLATALVRLEDA